MLALNHLLGFSCFVAERNTGKDKSQKPSDRLSNLSLMERRMDMRNLGHSLWYWGLNPGPVHA
jgi:hypothetical protein